MPRESRASRALLSARKKGARGLPDGNEQDGQGTSSSRQAEPPPRFTAPEFTTLCPITGQPDFAHLVIDYVPGKWLAESKSLKLYLASFRNVGGFHEDCTIAIGKKLAALLKPKFLRIGGYWYPRGGMPIDVFWQTGKLPAGVWLPDQGVAPYRGRG